MLMLTASAESMPKASSMRALRLAGVREVLRQVDGALFVHPVLLVAGKEHLQADTPPCGRPRRPHRSRRCGRCLRVIWSEKPTSQPNFVDQRLLERGRVGMGHRLERRHAPLSVHKMRQSATSAM